LAACGSGGPVASAQTGSGPGKGTVQFARCMRAHGVPNFPDPRFPAGGGIGFATPLNVSPDSPAAQHAQQVCQQP
jgi:hypothetical protein